MTNIIGTNVPDDGIADLLTGNNCPAYIGRLPWRTLGLPDLRDGSGERLWYALSPNYRDHPSAGALNSDTLGQLAVTGATPTSNVVAIIFAPGGVVEISPGTTQTRDTNVAPCTTTGTPLQNNWCTANHLEGENANGLPPTDLTFITSLASENFNDRSLTITTDELMRQIEKRVAGETRKAINSFRTSYGTYPWLAPFDPTASEYVAIAGTNQGALPFHYIGQTFTTPFTWTITGPCTLTPILCFNISGTVTYFDMLNGLTVPGSCIWKHSSDVTDTDPNSQVNCTGVANHPLVFGATRTVNIVYVAPIGSWTPSAATATQLTRRNVIKTDLSSMTVTLTDTDQLTGLTIGSGSLTGVLTTGTIVTSDIRVHPAMPDWYGSQSAGGNNWHQLIYAAIAPGFVPGAAQSCVAPASCFTVQLNSTTNASNVQAVVLTAGRTLASTEYLALSGPPDPPQTRPNTNLYSYLDSTNNITAGTLVFDRKTLPFGTFNDQVRIVAP
jgi:hypothetical protein